MGAKQEKNIEQPTIDTEQLRNDVRAFLIQAYESLTDADNKHSAAFMVLCELEGGDGDAFETVFPNDEEMVKTLIDHVSNPGSWPHKQDKDGNYTRPYSISYATSKAGKEAFPNMKLVAHVNAFRSWLKRNRQEFWPNLIVATVVPMKETKGITETIDDDEQLEAGETVPVTGQAFAVPVELIELVAKLGQLDVDKVKLDVARKLLVEVKQVLTDVCITEVR